MNELDLLLKKLLNQKIKTEKCKFCGKDFVSDYRNQLMCNNCHAKAKQIYEIEKINDIICENIAKLQEYTNIFEAYLDQDLSKKMLTVAKNMVNGFKKIVCDKIENK